MKKIIKPFIANFITRIIKLINGPYVCGFLVNSRNFKFLIQTEDMSVGRQLRKYGNYSIEEKNRISSLINENSVVAFIGAHVGTLSIPIASQVKKAIFVEANPNTFFFLESNIKINRINNVVSHNIAVGESDGEINFILNKTNPGESKREPISKKKMYYSDSPKIISIPMKTFDSIAKNFSDYFDLILIDIEGSEFFALKGMQEVLSKTQNLIIEFVPHHLKNVANVKVNEFLKLIIPHFKYCFIPSSKKLLNIEDTVNELNKMFDKKKLDEGIVFMKSKFNFE